MEEFLFPIILASLMIGAFLLSKIIKKIYQSETLGFWIVIMCFVSIFFMTKVISGDLKSNVLGDPLADIFLIFAVIGILVGIGLKLSKNQRWSSSSSLGAAILVYLAGIIMILNTAPLTYFEDIGVGMTAIILTLVFIASGLIPLLIYFVKPLGGAFGEFDDGMGMVFIVFFMLGCITVFILNRLELLPWVDYAAP